AADVAAPRQSGRREARAGKPRRTKPNTRPAEATIETERPAASAPPTPPRPRREQRETRADTAQQQREGRERTGTAPTNRRSRGSSDRQRRSTTGNQPAERRRTTSGPGDDAFSNPPQRGRETQQEGQRPRRHAQPPSSPRGSDEQFG